MNYFIMVFEREPGADYTGFHRDFVAHDQINNWWHFISNTYLVVTELETSDLTEHVKVLFAQHNLPKRHLILEANFGDRDGLLPKRAWEWLDRQAKKQWEELNPDKD